MRIVIPTRAFLVVLVLSALVGGGAILIDWLIVTDVERINDLFDDAARAGERHDVDTVVDSFLHEEFLLGDMDREDFRKCAKNVLTTFEVASIRKYSSEVTVEGEDARATVRTFVRGGRIPREQRVDWEVELRRTPEGPWKIRRVQAFYFHAGERRALNLKEAVRYAESL